MGRIVITGANRGIGLAMATQFAARGDDVVAGCREASSELRAVDGVRVIEGLEVSDGDAVAAFAKEVGAGRIDVLINNAGILTGETLQDMSFERIQRQFEVNSMGPLRVTRALLDRIGEGSKVALITSRMGSIADNTSGSRYGYRMSKAALNAAGVSLAHDLRPRGAAVAILHPGFVRTGMTGGMGQVDADESARGLIARIDALTLETSGTFWHAQGEVLPW
ncbi:MAG: SDR family oxidoreductase [Myxococcales bacterium]|nr:SDR family oxidoreductase [Myxococcales bacterium]